MVHLETRPAPHLVHCRRDLGAALRHEMADADYRSSMDIGHFDFEMDEVVDLIPRLTDLAETIVLEPRSHQADEDEELHPIRTEPTFRVSCKLSWAIKPSVRWRTSRP